MLSKFKQNSDAVNSRVESQASLILTQVCMLRVNPSSLLSSHFLLPAPCLRSVHISN